MDFYSASAQVIPVLYLAMAFESKWLFRLPDSLTVPMTLLYGIPLGSSACYS